MMYSVPRIRKINPQVRPTVRMTAIERDTILMIDSTVGAREAFVHERPTVQMEAVRLPGA